MFLQDENIIFGAYHCIWITVFGIGLSPCYGLAVRYHDNHTQKCQGTGGALYVLLFFASR